MRKTFIIIMCLSTLYLQGKSQDDVGIKFEEGSLKTAFQKAKQENKMLFVDVFASWCGPCKRFSQKVFTLPEVGAFFNQHFVCYKLQTDSKDTLKKSEARNFTKTYDVSSYPTLLWLSPDGKMQHYSIGYKEGPELIEIAKQALDPKTNAANVMQKWANGDRSLQTGLVYFKLKSDSVKEFDDFYAQLSQKDKLNPKLQSLMLWSMSFPPESRTLHYIAKHRESMYLPDSAGFYWDRLLEMNLESNLIKAKTEKGQDSILNMYRSYNLPYLNICKDKVNCLKDLKKGQYEDFFSGMRHMMQTYSDYSFVHPLTLEVGYMLEDGHLKSTTEPKEFIDWVNMYIQQKKPKQLRADLYRLIAYSLQRDPQNAIQQQKLYEDALEKADYDADYKKSLKEESEALVKAANR